MKKINWKANKGVTMNDIVIAMIILSLFVGVISSLFYQIAYHNTSIQMNAMAVHYAVRIAESIDKMKYEEVDETLNNTLNETYELPDSFNATIKVDNYSQNDTSKLDIIKIVRIEVDYEFMNETRSYGLKKLKIKEY